MVYYITKSDTFISKPEMRKEVCCKLAKMRLANWYLAHRILLTLAIIVICLSHLIVKQMGEGSSRVRHI